MREMGKAIVSLAWGTEESNKNYRKKTRGREAIQQKERKGVTNGLAINEVGNKVDTLK